MMGQKEAVVDAVKTLLPNFVPYKDIALMMLSSNQLEDIKQNIGLRIRSGNIEYSKARHNAAEVMAYARSMVMNHLKKAKELNGNSSAASTNSLTTKSKKEAKNFKGIDMDILPDDLKEFVRTLV